MEKERAPYQDEAVTLLNKYNAKGVIVVIMDGIRNNELCEIRIACLDFAETMIKVREVGHALLYTVGATAPNLTKLKPYLFTRN